jgi:hypothetical protein
MPPDEHLRPSDYVVFRRRYYQAQVAMGVVGGAFLLLALFASLSVWIWLALILAGGLVGVALEIRGQRCPRCRGFVFGWIGEDKEGISLVGPPPERCQNCDVRLKPE